MTTSGEWKKPKGRNEWDARTEKIAALIPPGSRVLEFGAWTRHLEKHLPPGCTYIPSDIYSRGDDTIVCNLNGDLPTFPVVDIVVFSGVLEYVEDVPRLISHLAGSCTTIIATYSFTGRHWPYGGKAAQFLEAFEKNGFQKTYQKPYDPAGRQLMMFEKAQHET